MDAPTQPTGANVSLAEAARLLGVSGSDVLRLIADGKLVADVRIGSADLEAYLELMIPRVTDGLWSRRFAIDADGSRAVTTSHDNLHLWSSETGRLIREALSHVSHPSFLVNTHLRPVEILAPRAANDNTADVHIADVHTHRQGFSADLVYADADHGPDDRRTAWLPSEASATAALARSSRAWVGLVVCEGCFSGGGSWGPCLVIVLHERDPVAESSGGAASSSRESTVSSAVGLCTVSGHKGPNARNGAAVSTGEA